METLIQRKIFVFWAPLALTWLMIGVESPFLAAVVARLPNPEPNLAAWGIAVAIAILVEAPVIMIMSASTALAKDRVAFVRLRAFTYILSAAITFFMLAALLSPAMDHLVRRAMTVPDDVATLTVHALFILLPWPAAIGYRRFYQGLLIRDGQTRKVALGTVIRLGSMSATALILYLGFALPGAYVGAAALTAGVVMEALASRLMAINIVGKLATVTPEGDPITYREIWTFYFPLALTSTIYLTVHPMTSFFLGRSRMSLESLAVMPVIGALVFLFRAVGISFMEAAIALLGDRFEHNRAVRRFAVTLAVTATAALGLVAFTPLSGLWFEKVSGLSKELADFSAVPTMIMVLIPAASVYFSYQRAVMVKAQRTPPITWSTTLQVVFTVAALFIAVELFDIIGAVAATGAMVLGSVLGNTLLLTPVARAVKQFTSAPAPSGR